MIVLDTNVLSEPLRLSPEPHVLRWLAETAEQLALTSITVGELLTGVGQLADERRKDTLLTGIEQVLSDFSGHILAFDDAAARRYATVRVEGRRSGRPISVEDGMIAAICLSHGAKLATRNTRDFVGIDLTSINPWAPA